MHSHSLLVALVTMALSMMAFLLFLAVPLESSRISCAHLLAPLPIDSHPPELSLLVEHKQFLCLLASRLKIGREVALYKWQHKKAIYDPTREQFILAAMVAKANSSGLDSVWSAKFFTDEMEANRKMQEYTFHQWKVNQVDLSNATHVDLYGSIRPRLDAINGKLIQLAAKTVPLRSSEWCFPLTDSQLLSIDHELTFDFNEATIFRDYALRNVCLKPK